MMDLIERQAAIDFVDAGHLCNPNEPRWSDNEVVNFLKSRPSVQPEPCEDAVSRHRLLNDLKELIAAWKKYPVMAEQIKGVETAIGYVQTIPSAQPEKAQLSGEDATFDCISRQAVIDVLATMQGRCTSKAALIQNSKIWQQIKDLPSVQPEERTEERTETHACDCISRQAVIDAVFALNTDCVSWLDAVIDMLDALPSAQPYTDEEIQKMQDLHQAEIEKAFDLGREDARAEIIHCGECKHWREGTAFSFCDKLHGMGVLDALDYMTAEDDYCSMAEREDDG